ncbi:MAG TPA: hypothetical protein VFP37_18795 [Steroidobacteraceae bacterium]|nr:hypothetical protein [Steroidobacteraceae bacterium]
MSRPTCIAAIPTGALLAYWLGEDAADEARVEEHLMGCTHCSARLQGLVQLADGIRRATRAGLVHAVLSASFVERLRASGLRVREYRMQPGGSVACTVTPEDDLVVSHLHAPLRDVRRLDVVFEDLVTGHAQRMPDVAFDPSAGEIVLAPNTSLLRTFESGPRRARLIAVHEGADRELGTYTFNHVKA